MPTRERNQNNVIPPGRPEAEQDDPPFFMPVGLAVLGGSVQLGTCGTKYVNIGTSLGLTLSLAAVVLGHVFLRRLQRGRGGRAIAWFALAIAYLSLLAVPLAGYGILVLSGGFAH